MVNLSIKELNIQNYKCFDDIKLDFSVPNGVDEWSWLNILIWENWNWKTTILESINYLTLNSFSVENKLSISDFNNHEKPINITWLTKDEFKCNLEFPYKDSYFESKWLTFNVKNRDSKERWKLLSSLFQVSSWFFNINENYKKSDWVDSWKEIPWKYKWFDSSIIKDGDINIFLFDKNRTRQLSIWNYKTTFEKICDDLNWKFLNNITSENKDNITKNIVWDYFKNILEVSQKWTWKKLWEEMKDFFKNDDFLNLKIDLLKLLHPFTNSFFTIRKDNDLKQLNIKDLGSWIEMILTLFLLKDIAWESKWTIIYLIDEPELHLHPKAQETLIELLLKESKDKQIFISTHSPYIFKNCLINNKVWLYILSKENWKVEVNNIREKWWGLFPWSPSWWEINYYAYNLPTIEFHNELYWYIQEKTEKYKEDDIEDYFISKSISKTKKWKKILNWTPQKEKEVSLQTYIRNRIHHPENTLNIKETNEELEESIKKMIEIIKSNKL